MATYVPYEGNPLTYAFGPGHSFFREESPLAAAPATPPRTQPTQPTLPPGFYGDAPDATAPVVDNPHPNPTFGNFMGTVGTALGMMGNPIGTLVGALGALALSDALGMKPSFGLRGTVANAFSRGDENAVRAEANPGARGQLKSDTFDPATTAFADMGGKDIGNFNDSVSDPGKGEPGTAGEKGDFRRGGLVELFAGGGKIASGPGGGLDDLIPTTIDGKRPAALSDGEFVIPADVVGMLGDGSSNAGSRRLYDLVKTIRQMKTGTARQAAPIQFNKVVERVVR